MCLLLKTWVLFETVSENIVIKRLAPASLFHTPVIQTVCTRAAQLWLKSQRSTLILIDIEIMAMKSDSTMIIKQPHMVSLNVYAFHSIISHIRELTIHTYINV